MINKGKLYNKNNEISRKFEKGENLKYSNKTKKCSKILSKNLIAIFITVELQL